MISNEAAVEACNKLLTTKSSSRDSPAENFARPPRFFDRFSRLFADGVLIPQIQRGPIDIFPVAERTIPSVLFHSRIEYAISFV